MSLFERNAVKGFWPERTSERPGSRYHQELIRLIEQAHAGCPRIKIFG
jgi:hypothetical protein